MTQPPANFSQDLIEWRRDTSHRRGLVRQAVVDILRDGARTMENRICWLKWYVGYTLQNQRNRCIVRKLGWQIRKIIRGWHKVDEVTRDEFFAGRIAPSTLATQLS